MVRNVLTGPGHGSLRSPSFCRPLYAVFSQGNLRFLLPPPATGEPPSSKSCRHFGGERSKVWVASFPQRERARERERERETKKGCGLFLSCAVHKLIPQPPYLPADQPKALIAEMGTRPWLFLTSDLEASGGPVSNPTKRAPKHLKPPHSPWDDHL